MRSKKLNEAELKKIAQSMAEQEEQVQRLLHPKVLIEATDLQEMRELLEK